MPRKTIKKLLPDPKKIREHKSLKCLGSLLHQANLWHLNRRSVSGAFSVGLFCAWIPIPFQMLVAAVVAIRLKVNLPISVTLVWISNPVTMPALFYAAYLLGATVLDIPPQETGFELSFEWLVDGLLEIWQPFLLGCLILGTLSAIIGNALIRIIWRLRVIKALEHRRMVRQQQAAARADAALVTADVKQKTTELKRKNSK